MAWDPETPSEILAIHGAVLPSGDEGEVLLFGGDEHNYNSTETASGAPEGEEYKKTRLFDVKTGALLPLFGNNGHPLAGVDFASPQSDVFCSGHAFIGDGRLLIVGGTSEWGGGDGYHDHALDFRGHRRCWLYNPFARKWIEAARMAPRPGAEESDAGGGRWYPGVAPLPDGDIIAFYGHPVNSDIRHRNTQPERYHFGGNVWKYLPEELASSSKEPGGWHTFEGNNIPFEELPDEEKAKFNDGIPNNEAPYAFGISTLMYPRTFAIPGSKFFIATPQPVEAMTPSYIDYGKDDGPFYSTFFNLVTGKFEGTPLNNPAGGYEGWGYGAVLLPLLNEDIPEVHVLMAGTSATSRVNISEAAPAWHDASPRNPGEERTNSNIVLLPTGDVCLIGGVSVNGNNDPLIDEVGVLYPEIYKPGITWNANGTGTFAPFDGGNPASPFGDSWETETSDKAQHARNYHSIALLLPNGKVLTAGGNTKSNSGPPDDDLDLVGGGTIKLGMKQVELYKPAYLNNPALQPDLGTVPGFFAYGQNYTINTPDAVNIQRVGLMRCGSVTHNFNPDQRYVALKIISRTANTITVKAPKDGWVAPPGYYMLWIINNNNLPCKKAKFVRLAHVSCSLFQSRDSFSKEEIQSYINNGSDAVYTDAFHVFIDGYRGEELTGTPSFSIADLTTGTTYNNAAFQVTFHEKLLEIEAGDPFFKDKTQRITFTFTLKITDANIFDIEKRKLQITFKQGHLECTADVTLTLQPTPYMIDVEPGKDNPHWLSTDIRVFQTTEGTTLFSNIAQGASGVAYIKNVTEYLRSLPYNDAHPFNLLKDEQEDSALTLKQTIPTPQGNKKLFNYAVARVRYRAETTPAPDVRVFFRMFPALTTSLAYNTSDAYRIFEKPNGEIVPLPGYTGGGLSSIHFLGVDRVNASSNLTTQDEDTLNKQTITAVAGQETVMYFGCWLDINDPETPRFAADLGTTTPTQEQMNGPFNIPQSILNLVRNEHQCIVAEVYFKPDPTDTNDTPASSDNLAQRNIAWDASDNPGGPDTHTVCTTLEIQPSKMKLPDGFFAAGEMNHFINDPKGDLVRYQPDELVFYWNNLPRESEITLYLGNLFADDFLLAASLRNSNGVIEKTDPHTLCIKPGNITYLAIPGGIAKRIPILLTIKLPDNVVYGQLFSVAVHQYSGQTRLITGTFQFEIPVKKAVNLLAPETERLSIMKYILAGIPQTDRWHPVFKRYVGLIGKRVSGFGGNPDSVFPHPNGEGVPYIPPAVKTPAKCFDGTAVAIITAIMLTGMAFTNSTAMLVLFLATGVTFIAALAAWGAMRCCCNIKCALLDYLALGSGVALGATAVGVLLNGSGPFLGKIFIANAILVAVLLLLGYLLRCRGALPDCCAGADTHKKTHGGSLTHKRK